MAPLRSTLSLTRMTGDGTWARSDGLGLRRGLLWNAVKRSSWPGPGPLQTRFLVRERFYDQLGFLGFCQLWQARLWPWAIEGRTGEGGVPAGPLNSRAIARIAESSRVAENNRLQKLCSSTKGQFQTSPNPGPARTPLKGPRKAPTSGGAGVGLSGSVGPRP